MEEIVSWINDHTGTSHHIAEKGEVVLELDECNNLYDLSMNNGWKGNDGINLELNGLTREEVKEIAFKLLRITKTCIEEAFI